MYCERAPRALAVGVRAALDQAGRHAGIDVGEDAHGIRLQVDGRQCFGVQK
jgi:hypothetical protein